MFTIIIIRAVRILCRNTENSVHHFCEFCALLKADFSTLKLSVALLYHNVCHTSMLAWFHLVCSLVLCCVHFYASFTFSVLFYYFYTERFALAVAAASAELRAILLNKTRKTKFSEEPFITPFFTLRYIRVI